MVALIAVDIGGTTMRAASYPDNGTHPLIQKKTNTHSADEVVFDRLVSLIRSVWPSGEKVTGISVATPGPLDPKTGFIFNAPNIHGWKDFPLGEKLRDVFPIPSFVGNDANLAAVGEWKFGAGKGHRDLIYMTISTGIGGGIICNNQLLEGYLGLAAELGHIVVIPNGPDCPCGRTGHLEAVSSGPAIALYVKQELASGKVSSLQGIENLTAVEIARAAKDGDNLAIQAFDRAGFYLGLALADFVHIFNPSIIILGGGVSQSGPLLFEPAKKKLQEEIMDPIYLKDLKIVPAMLGDDAGLLGAFAYVKEKLNI